MSIRIIDGTPKHDVPSLCLSCENASIASTEKDTFIRCGVFRLIMKEKITKCNSWGLQDSTPLLNKTAWIYGQKYNSTTDSHEEKTFHPPGVIN